MQTAHPFTQLCSALSFFSGLMLTGICGRLMGRALGHGADPEQFPPEFMLIYGLIAAILGLGSFIVMLRSRDDETERFPPSVIGTFLCGIGIAGFLIMFYGLILR